MSEGRLHGVVVPVLTPVDDQDRVDEPALRKLIRSLIEAGVQGLFVGGSAGEGPLLRTREWQRMVEIAVDENRGDVALLGGAIDTSTERVIDKIGFLSNAGYRYLVVTPTYYIALKSPDEHLRLFGECAARAPGRELIAYNIPSCTGSQIPIRALVTMAERGWIRYCKESSGDLVYFRQLMAETRGLGLDVFMGDEANIGTGLREGACGIVPVCANYDPAPYLAACRAARDGDWAALERVQAQILEIKAALVNAGPNWIAGLKYAVACRGIGSGKPVSPLQPLTEDAARRVAAFHERNSLRGGPS